MTRYAHITGWGMAIPDKILTNDDLAKIVDTNDDWIFSRTGIHERRIANAEETTASLATEAAIQALQMANLQPEKIDLIIVSTSSPEHLFPATACLVQDNIGAVNAGAFDLSAACSGFIFALNMATQAIRSYSGRNALVIGSETLSRLRITTSASSFTPLPWCYSVLLPPCWFLISNVAEWIRHKYPWYIQSFNLGMYFITVECTSLIYTLIDPSHTFFSANNMIALIIAMATFTFINHLLVGMVVWLARGEDLTNPGSSTSCPWYSTSPCWRWAPQAPFFGW